MYICFSYRFDRPLLRREIDRSACVWHYISRNTDLLMDGHTTHENDNTLFLSPIIIIITFLLITIRFIDLILLLNRYLYSFFSCPRRNITIMPVQAFTRTYTNLKKIINKYSFQFHQIWTVSHIKMCTFIMGGGSFFKITTDPLLK